MILQDNFSCSGLAADGYAAVFGARALRGTDIEAQPLYPYSFTQGDCIALLEDTTGPMEEADASHNSPPCQFFTTAGHLRKAQGGAARFPDLLTPSLALLRKNWTHKPWVVENVDDNQGMVRAIMEPQRGESLIMLCGSMFGLKVQRHRLFLANFPLRQPDPVPGGGKWRGLGCDHSTFEPDPVTGKPRPWGVAHVPNDNIPNGGRTARDAEHGRQVMGSHRSLPWARLKEGFPPAYTSWVGADLLAALNTSVL